MRPRSLHAFAPLVVALVGCAARTSAAEPQSDAAPDADAVFAVDAPPDPTACAITWMDDTALARGVDRYVAPVITGDRDGFLFVSVAHPADPNAMRASVVVERFSSSGAVAGATQATLERPERRVRLYAGSDPTGAGHYAMVRSAEPFSVVAGQSADVMLWGSGPAWSEPRTIALDPTRGLRAVAFDGDGVLLLTHEWMSEGTIGEGGLYPIRPRVEHASLDGAVTEGPRRDPTEGTYFLEATLASVPPHTWLVTESFSGGAVRAAGDAWTGALRERALPGSYAAATVADGSLVLADSYSGEIRLARVDHRGAFHETTTLPDSATTSAFALATDGDRVLVVHRTTGGSVRATVLDARLEVRATSIVPGADGLGVYVQLGAAAARDGTFALFAGPGASTIDHRQPVPVMLRRFRACD